MSNEVEKLQFCEKISFYKINEKHLKHFKFRETNYNIIWLYLLLLDLALHYAHFCHKIHLFGSMACKANELF